jgi:hypothetical protein
MSEEHIISIFTHREVKRDRQRENNKKESTKKNKKKKR